MVYLTGKWLQGSQAIFWTPWLRPALRRIGGTLEECLLPMRQDNRLGWRGTYMQLA
jgi:hypothetical protein